MTRQPAAPAKPVTSLPAHRMNDTITDSNAIEAYSRQDVAADPIMPAPGDIAFSYDAAPDVHALHLIFCGGFHSSMRGLKASHFAELARARKLSFTRFDYRGHGESAGDARALGIAHWLADTLTVIDDAPGRLVLIGSSMGAWMALLACERRSRRIAGLLTIAAAPDFTTELLVHSLEPDERRAVEQGQMAWRNTPYSDTPWPIPPVLVDSGRNHSVLTSDQLLKLPATLIHGSADKDVPVELSRKLHRTRFTDKARLVEVEGADHRLSDPSSLTVLAQELDSLLVRIGSSEEG